MFQTLRIYNMCVYVSVLSMNLNLTVKVEQTKLHVKKIIKTITLVRHGRSARDLSDPQMERCRSARTDNFMRPSSPVMTRLGTISSLSVRPDRKSFIRRLGGLVFSQMETDPVKQMKINGRP